MVAGSLSKGGRIVALVVLVVWTLVLLASAPGRDYYLQDSDHGFQLCLGSQVLFGKTPGIDLFSSYGPLIAYTSALGQWVTGSLVGESVICVLGYAIALTLVHLLVARYASSTSGVLASVAAFFVLARFYKWYVWLWPLAALVALSRCLGRADEAEAPSRRALVLLGVVLGVGWLYRPDLGTTGLAGALAVGLWLELGRAPRDVRAAWRRSVLVVLGFAVPVGAWFLYLLVTEGVAGCVYYLRSTFLGALMAQSGMGTRAPTLDLLRPRSADTMRVLGYVFLVATYGACLWHGLRRGLAGSGPERGRARFLLAVGVVGLGVVHQALHRMDVQHLLQVFAPAVVGAFVIGHASLATFRRREGAPGAVAKSAGLLYALLGLWCVVGLARWSRVDLFAPSSWPDARWRGIARLQSRRPHPLLLAVRRMQELTDPDDAVLVFPLGPQLYVFLDRRMSGRLHAYYPGVYATPPWSDDNLRAIEADPPAAILVPPNFHAPELDPAQKLDRYRAGHAYLDDWLRERYTEVLYADRFALVLGRPGGG